MFCGFYGKVTDPRELVLYFLQSNFSSSREVNFVGQFCNVRRYFSLCKCSCLIFLGTVLKIDFPLYMDGGVGCVTMGDRFSVGVICSLPVRYFCKTLLYNLSLS